MTMGKSVNIFITFFTAIYGDVKEAQAYDCCMDGKIEKGYVTGSLTNEAPAYSMAKMLQEKGEKIDYIYGFSTNDERTPHFEVKVFGEAEKRPPYKNQVDFFQSFMTERCPALQKAAFRFIDFEYPTEKLDRECVRQAIHAAERIKKEMNDAGHCWSDCRLYVDVTGGIRAADMVLSQIIHLLQHDGMKVEKILYSDYQKAANIPNRLFNITALTSLSQLIAGADAFVKYGSSLTLEEYFDYDYENNASGAYELSEPLKKLLHAMHRYSDVMQICQVDAIKSVLADLKHALDEFSQHNIAADSLKEKAFSLMLDTIKKAYEDILKYAEGEEAALYYEMIRWCLKNGFIQQAMTLYVEWMPIYLEEKRVFYPVWREMMQARMVDDVNPAWQKTVLDFCSKALYLREKQTYCLKKLRAAVQNIKEKRENPLAELEERIPAKGREVLQMLLDQRENIEKMGTAENIKEYIEKLPELKKLYEEIMKYPPPDQAGWKDFEKVLHDKAGMENTCNTLRGMRADGACEIYGLGQDLSKKALPKKSETPEERAAEFKVLLDEDILRTDYAMEDVLALVADYRRIRRARNGINHAGNIKSTGNKKKQEERKMNRRDMARLLGDCIARIDNLRLGEKK
ncbi:CRISPR-associated (Cas) DxTHG domain protein [Selenomonas sp. CM52]|nr:CRISPR-associated (Cas) DxTHG domain protein [Selenomonas sp. CM52]